MEEYDVIILGAGQAGLPLALALVKSGRKTALIEEKFIGGTCINFGCTPTKTMVASAEAAYMARRAADFGVHAGAVSVDMGVVRQRKDSIVESFRSGDDRKVLQAGVHLLRGSASFTGPRQLQVVMNEGSQVRHASASAPVVVINAGARPRRLTLEGADQVPYLDSTSVQNLEAVPEHLLILGGGYVALEYGQMFRRFGSQVTIVQRAGQLLDREDADVAAAARDILVEDGVEVLLDTTPLRVERRPGGAITLTVQTPQGPRELSGTHLLAAVGRDPNTERLNLAAAGVELDARGYVRTNAYLETSATGVYATGDIKGGPAFTHISYDDFRILRSSLIEGKKVSIEGRMLPYVLFMDPQIARVGLSEKDAQAQKLNYRVAKIPMTWVARAIELDRTRGFVKALVDADTRQILGAAVIGVEGGEVMAMLEIAMLGKLPYPVLREAIFAHPTLSELLNTLFFELE
jgi:pyruvate/2-oxoglutarate dehydrogenase complex dihydrolipoamide dehydrogenase (E3) component